MKKFKFLSMALVATAIVGCTSDDLNVAGNYVLPGDGTEVLATINDPGLDGGSMRAAFATNVTGNISTISQKAYFSEGDEFKMYCTDTWKPQVYKFKQYAGIEAANAIDASVFTWADEDSKYNKKDENILSGREYGVFPADSFLFPDENRSVLEYHIANQINYGEQKGKSVTGEARKLYNSLVPMFGFCVDDKITFNYMTSLLRVEMMGVTVDQPYTLVLTSDDDYYKMSGTFNSTVFDAADYTADDAHLPVFGMQKDTEVDKAKGEGYLAVTVTPKEADVAVYLPIPTGLYDVDKLKLYCVEKEIGESDNLNTNMSTFLGGTAATTIYTRDTTAITLDNPQGRKIANKETYPTGYNLGRGTYLLAVVGDAMNVAGVKINSLEDLNKIIKTYSTYKRAVAIQVELENAITIKDNTEAIRIPQLENDLTVKIVGSGKTISGTDGLRITNETGQETDKGFTAKLEFDSGIVGADVTCDVKQNFTLGGTITGHKVEFNPATAVKVGLDGTINQNAPITVKNASVVTIYGNMASVIVEKATKVEVPGRVANLNVKANTNIDVTGKEGIATKLTIQPKVHVDITVSGVGNIKEIEAKEGEKEDHSEDATFTINATWDEETTEAIEGADANEGEIYTALQLAALMNSSSSSLTDINLYANVTVADEEAEWTPLSLTLTKFDGNNNTIKGLVIKAAENAENVGFISELGTANVTNLTLENLVVDVAAKKDNLAHGIGALAGTAGAATIDNVNIKGAKLNGLANTYAIGGLIGSVNGNLTVKETVVDAAITGYYSLGGLIGVIEGGEVTIGAATDEETGKNNRVDVSKTTTIKVLAEFTTDTDAAAGKVGLVVGSLASTLKLDNFYYLGSWANDVMAKVDSDWKYNKQQAFLSQNLKTFKGNKYNGSYRAYVGYSPVTAAEVSVGETSLKNCYINERDYVAPTNNSFNVFE